MAALTLKYLRDNPDITEAGYQFGEQMSLFVDGTNVIWSETEGGAK